jgi:hypothetical protein
MVHLLIDKTFHFFNTASKFVKNEGAVVQTPFHFIYLSLSTQSITSPRYSKTNKCMTILFFILECFLFNFRDRR